jgi:dephospho-CoA kinase
MEFKKHNSKIIILTGKAQSGKNETANIIKKYLEKQNNKTIIISYAKYLKDYAKEITNWNGKESTKPREFLQQLGVELIKNKIDEDFLINRIKEDIKIYEYFFDTIIISDARFISEIEAIKTKNKIVIKIEGKENKLTKLEKEHITEKALDNYNNYDYIIQNKTTKQELKKQIKQIMEEI